MVLLCWLFGHKDRPHYAATPQITQLGLQCARCLRVAYDLNGQMH